MKRLKGTSIFFISMLFSILATAGQTENQTKPNILKIGILARINELRKANSLHALERDHLLESTASKYAKQLGARGIISHRDQSGNRAMDRYRREGGTPVRVGEIIGAGNNFDSIWKLWIKSTTHREVILDPLWSHVGIGIDETNGVYVILFTTHYTRNLKVTLKKSDGISYVSVTGIMDTSLIATALIPTIYAGSKTKKAKITPILFVGYKRYMPVEWDENSGIFKFIIEKKDFSFCRIAVDINDSKLLYTDLLPDIR